MSANGTAIAKGMETKSQKAAREMAERAAMVEVAVGDGRTLVKKDSAAAKAAAERQRLIDVEKARLAAESVNSEAPVVDPIPAVQKTPKKRAAAEAPSIVQIAAENPEAVVVEPVEAPAVAEAPAPVKEKKPYNPEKLSGAAEAGKAPKKGQLPAGLLKYLAAKHEKSTIIAAAAGIAAPAKKAKKAKK